jgi:hypothetical protein
MLLSKETQWKGGTHNGEEAHTEVFKKHQLPGSMEDHKQEIQTHCCSQTTEAYLYPGNKIQSPLCSSGARHNLTLSLSPALSPHSLHPSHIYLRTFAHAGAAGNTVSSAFVPSTNVISSESPS